MIWAQYSDLTMNLLALSVKRANEPNLRQGQSSLSNMSESRIVFDLLRRILDF